MAGLPFEVLAHAGVSIFGLRFEDFSASLEWPLFVVLLVNAFSLFTTCMQVPAIWEWMGGRIEPRGKKREDADLDVYDHVYVLINKFVTVPYAVVLRRVLRHADWMAWELSECGPVNTFLVVPLCLGAYDLFYAPFHRTLHVPWMYPYIHKHHHRQVVPFRGTYDGINTHPIEYTLGIFNHILAILVVKTLLGFMGLRVHWYGALAFLIISGFMASLNHTRWGVRILGVFDVRDHDVHHRWPRSNYGQFVMWWDRLAGTFKPYETTLGVDTSFVAKERPKSS